ncbi:transcriptional regulator, TraR/DksA family [Alkaliphilus metalliredigens QYMF]|uniref:Transcriptional regulator, TraR/DksA family n=1 Tax=Alkaliphilus metalliredigens (strain QYMF) TaxID=293826 RepID=A6TRY0_ALKMQ|nr:TraR/DksA C4-type zinc finger protein [Alkaliphilus metalliredigens]ABR48948.1 transcriptional regulator, TraR/DksA family [Alkaliphilus metalliredigens QYMF]
MDPKKQGYFKRRLHEEKNNALETLTRMEANQGDDESMRENTGELSAYDNHPADLGSEMFMMSMQANLENHERYRVTEIDRALEKIQEGTYGECQLCGQGIPDERLEVMPEANICMVCAMDKIPIEIIQHNRPVEEKLMSPSFRTSHRDYNEFTGFDEEDAYQAVAKFNEVKNDPSFSTGDHLGVFDEEPEGIVGELDQITEEEYLNQLSDVDLVKEKTKDEKDR